jgi:chemotaxis protein MotA
MVILGQLLEGGTLASITQLTAAVIVFGGTFGAVLISYPLLELRKAVASLGRVFTYQSQPPDLTIEGIVEIAGKVRQGGILALEDELDDLEDPFLAKAMALAVDGNRPQAVREMLEVEDDAKAEQDETSAEVYDAAGGYAPTIGILGAVLGLIHVMGSLSDADELGAGIAVAFVATLYGVGSANLLFLPIASKIRVKSQRASQHRRLVMAGVAAIQEGLNPRAIEIKLCSQSGCPVPKRPAQRRAA